MFSAYFIFLFLTIISDIKLLSISNSTCSFIPVIVSYWWYNKLKQIWYLNTAQIYCLTVWSSEVQNGCYWAKAKAAPWLRSFLEVLSRICLLAFSIFYRLPAFLRCRTISLSSKPIRVGPVLLTLTSFWFSLLCFPLPLLRALAITLGPTR